ncbi:hypothetical protein ACIBEJ_09885 [Nonomuraea sp. NPDC050790]|uniref:hypothetical protein n=1 Tax=Nonomuraea sp. NPDC050790 TaxID=3364371 RepID=UPI0037B21F6E
MNKLIALVASALLLVAVGAVQRLRPDADRVYQPLSSTGAVGQDVRTTPYTVRVERAETGRELELTGILDKKEKRATKGVWVVVHLTATATQERVQLGTVELEALNGTRYGVTDRFSTLDSADLDPGIPQRGVLAFELPPDAVRGTVLRITKARYETIFRLNSALGPGVEVPLGLSGDAVPTVTIAEGDS